MPPVVRSQRKGCCLFQVFAGEKMKKTEIKGVVFDMDGLMFDSERVVQLSWDQAGELMGLGKLGHNIYHTLGFNREKRKEYFKEKSLALVYVVMPSEGVTVEYEGSSIQDNIITVQYKVNELEEGTVGATVMTASFIVLEVDKDITEIK